MILPVTTDVLHGPSICLCLSVCLSVTLVHPAIGPNEMPFDKDTGVAPNNNVLDGVSAPTTKGDLGDRNCQSLSQLLRTVKSVLLFTRCQHLCRGDAVYRQISLAFVID